MQKTIFLFLSLTIGSLLCSCTTSTIYKDDRFNLQTQEVERYTYTPYYQLNTEIIAKKLELSLVTHLIKETIPGSYTIKKHTRRLLPNDYMVKSDTILILKNLTNQPMDLALSSISIENKRLPHSKRAVTIKSNESLSLPLGQILIDLRLTSLNTRVEYIDDKQKKNEKEFDMKRIISTIKRVGDNTKEQSR